MMKKAAKITGTGNNWDSFMQSIERHMHDLCLNVTFQFNMSIWLAAAAAAAQQGQQLRCNSD